MTDCIVTAVYADGGVIDINPSPIGGSWAWAWADKDGCMLHHASGAVQPDDIGVVAVTNNQTELLAAVRALRSLPPWWDGTLYTDSSCTRARLLGGRAFTNVPAWLVNLTLETRRNRRWKVELVAGHPTADDLRRGTKKRNGRPVHSLNDWVDKACGRAADALRASLSVQ